MFEIKKISSFYWNVGLKVCPTSLDSDFGLLLEITFFIGINWDFKWVTYILEPGATASRTGKYDSEDSGSRLVILCVLTACKFQCSSFFYVRNFYFIGF